MVIPLALTLAVTLPLTVTGLNQLASVTGTERLEDEILLVDKRLKLFGDDLEKSASTLAENRILLESVLESDSLVVRSILQIQG
ncbi:MAG: hypothetical protein OSB07_04345 [Dehalococcoidia bacterium]|nr:hypothetical protein [Dehalococcoidia bacterium]